MLPFLAATAQAADLLLTHARLWDGTGAPARDDVDILIHDERIAEVGPGLAAPEGATTVDLTGATVLPGLIDAHVHLSMDPGAGWRQDSPERHAELLRWHLRAYLACGVTTILDPAVLPDELAAIRAALADGAPGPRYLTLGTPLSPRGGYVAVEIPAFPSVGTPAEVEDQLTRIQAEDVVGVKVTVEQGLAAKIWPLYTDAVREAIVAGAAARGLPLYAHAMSPHEQALAVDQLHPKVLVHGIDRPDAEVIAQVHASGAYEISTLSIYDANFVAWEPARLTDPLVRLTVPAEEIATAADPTVIEGYERALIATAYPHLPAKGLVVRSKLPQDQAKKRLAHAEAGVRALADAGVPLVLGSDAGNWPVIPFLFHGPTSVRELELLGEAGLTPVAALTAATRTPAEMLGITRDVGTVQPGRVADLVVVAGDPLADLSALRQIRLTIHAGVAHTPAEWMETR